jgi:hypothetical protein
MTEPIDPMTPGQADTRAPGERRLARPPSDRYRESAPATEQEAVDRGRRGSIGLGLLYADLVALVGVAAVVVLGGVLALAAGLVVVAALIGRGVGLALILGAGDTLRPPRRTVIATGLAIASVLVGQVGLWWYAGLEGGVLSLVDYLGQTFGILVPVQVAVAGLVAWWTAR